MPFDPNKLPNTAESGESQPVEAGMEDLDFTVSTEVSPAELAAAEKDKNDIAAARKAIEDSYDWDSPNQRRAGFN